MIGLDILTRFAASECTQAPNSQPTVIDSSCLPHAMGGAGTIDTILSIVFGITAAIALLVMVIAGFRYIVAHGDPQSVAQARNAILYAVIGLVISVSAFSIVTFVVKGVS